MVEDNLKDNKRETIRKQKLLLKISLINIASSKSDDMAYLMDNPEGLEGTRKFLR